jgi:H+/Cl- antiporter ClcA
VFRSRLSCLSFAVCFAIAAVLLHQWLDGHTQSRLLSYALRLPGAACAVAALLLLCDGTFAHAAMPAAEEDAPPDPVCILQFHRHRISDPYRC